MKVGLKEEEPTYWREGAADDLVLGLSFALWMAKRYSGIPGATIVGLSEFGEVPSLGGLPWGYQDSDY